MGSPWVHRLTDIDREAKTATCSTCGPVPIRIRTSGKVRCRIAIRTERSRQPKSTGSARSRPYREHLGPTCEECGFVPEHPCQLDIHHMDSNHQNNDPANLQTLCANCHRLKTQRARTP